MRQALWDLLRLRGILVLISIAGEFCKMFRWWFRRLSSKLRIREGLPLAPGSGVARRGREGQCLLVAKCRERQISINIHLGCRMSAQVLYTSSSGTLVDLTCRSAERVWGNHSQTLPVSESLAVHSPCRHVFVTTGCVPSFLNDFLDKMFSHFVSCTWFILRLESSVS